jgi:hypothetical protein
VKNAGNLAPVTPLSTSKLRRKSTEDELLVEMQSYFACIYRYIVRSSEKQVVAGYSEPDDFLGCSLRSRNNCVF